MSESYYLVKVLGLSTIPRIATFGLKAVATTVMLAALGAEEYGVLVYVGAIVAVLESFADCGVSSAAGKNIAAARDARPRELHREIRMWIRLQTMAGTLGFLPLFGATLLLMGGSNAVRASYFLVGLVVAAAWITIAINLSRSVLTALLAFRRLAIFDTVESICRSVSFVCVAYAAPSATGLAVASLIVAVAMAVLGGVLIAGTMKSYAAGSDNISQPKNMVWSFPRHALNESVSFLWLRLGLRVFQALPLILIGRMFGAEVVGVVGGMARFVELVNFPFGVIGNALSVQSAAIVSRGRDACSRLWDCVTRILALALPIWASTFVASQLIVENIFRADNQALFYAQILSFTVVTSAVSSVVAPMSDFVGGLRRRNYLITMLAVIQLPVIYFAGMGAGPVGAIAGYVLVLLIMNCGYTIIALRLFFGHFRYRLRGVVWWFVVVTILSWLVSQTAYMLGLHMIEIPTLSYGGRVIQIVLMWSLIAVLLSISRESRGVFLSKKCLSFT